MNSKSAGIFARINNKAVTLMELVIIIVVLATISTIATVRMTSAVKQSTILKEEATVRMLTKVAVNYNTANDSWYGLNSTDDIFNQFLDSPPPHLYTGTDVFDGPDNRNWRLVYNAGPPTIYWYIKCPHHIWDVSPADCKGSMWRFYPKGGKLLKDMYSGPH